MKAILAFEIEPSVRKDITLPFFADGSPGIVFQQGGADLVSNRNKKIDSFFLYGQNVQPVELYTNGRFRLIAYLLYPHALKVLFGIKAKELTDICIDLAVHPVARRNSLADQLCSTPSVDQQVYLLNGFIADLAMRSRMSIDVAIQYATGIIHAQKGLASLSQLAKELQISQRSFQRRFEMEVGVSPKMFSRICQFRAAFTQLTGQGFSKLSDLAYDNGYADQSHFNRAFKEFTNYTPQEFLKLSEKW